MKLTTAGALSSFLYIPVLLVDGQPILGSTGDMAPQHLMVAAPHPIKGPEGTGRSVFRQRTNVVAPSSVIINHSEKSSELLDPIRRRSLVEDDEQLTWQARSPSPVRLNTKELQELAAANDSGLPSWMHVNQASRREVQVGAAIASQEPSHILHQEPVELVKRAPGGNRDSNPVEPRVIQGTGVFKVKPDLKFDKIMREHGSRSDQTSRSMGAQTSKSMGAQASRNVEEISSRLSNILSPKKKTEVDVLNPWYPHKYGLNPWESRGEDVSNEEMVRREVAREKGESLLVKRMEEDMDRDQEQRTGAEQRRRSRLPRSARTATAATEPASVTDPSIPTHYYHNPMMQIYAAPTASHVVQSPLPVMFPPPPPPPVYYLPAPVQHDGPFHYLPLQHASTSAESTRLALQGGPFENVHPNRPLSEVFPPIREQPGYGSLMGEPPKKLEP